jgi:hypothetical protein
VFANNLYLLEERPDGDWTDASHLGNYKKYNSTAQVQEKLRTNNKYKADQHSFLKARLFDILISDVDRHHDNWRWGLSDSMIFKPVPRDRDQAFFTHNGLLTKLAIAITRRRLMQDFDYDIKKVRSLTLTKKNRTLDRYFLNELNFEDWINTAHLLQQALTDDVITKSVSQLPPEVFDISGNEIIDKLKYRRDKLQDYAAQYYKEIARNVEVNGSSAKEYFIINQPPGKQISIEVFRVDKEGQKEPKPYYKRVLESGVTKQIIIDGNGGGDVFDIAKNIKGIKVLTRNNAIKN